MFALCSGYGGGRWHGWCSLDDNGAALNIHWSRRVPITQWPMNYYRWAVLLRRLMPVHRTMVGAGRFEIDRNIATNFGFCKGIACRENAH